MRFMKGGLAGWLGMVLGEVGFSLVDRLNITKLLDTYRMWYTGGVERK